MLDNAIRDRAGASEVHAPTVIGAYVARCLVARAVEAPVTARAGIIPTNGDQVCAWVGVPSAMAGDRRPEGQPHQVMGEIAPDWATAWPPARGTAPVRGFAGLPGYLRRPWGQGWALIGDAGYFKGPLTAHGMTETLRAELLACAHVAGAGDPVALDVALAGYAATRDLLSLPLFRLTDRVPPTTGRCPIGANCSWPPAPPCARRSPTSHGLDIDDLDQVPAAG